MASPGQAASGPRFAAPRTRLTVTEDKGDVFTVRVVASPCTDGGSARLSARVADWLPFTVPVGQGCTHLPQVQEGEAYEVDRTDLQRSGFLQSGWVYGALLLPYKYRFRGPNKGLDPSPSVGPYIGWRERQGATGRSYVASAGLASIKLADADGEQRVAHGVTWAVGVMFDVSKSAIPFKSGLFLGRDYLGRSEPTFKGGPWIALQIGYDFSE